MATIPQQVRSSQSGTLTSAGRSDSCSRCGGLMVLSFCVSPDQGTWDFQIPVGRCLQCGDLVDPTILHNRRQHLHATIQN